MDENGGSTITVSTRNTELNWFLGGRKLSTNALRGAHCGSVHTRQRTTPSQRYAVCLCCVCVVCDSLRIEATARGPRATQSAHAARTAARVARDGAVYTSERGEADEREERVCELGRDAIATGSLCTGTGTGTDEQQRVNGVCVCVWVIWGETTGKKDLLFS